MIVILILIAAAAFVVMRSARRDRGFRPELGPVGWVAGTDWSVVPPLARVETKRLLRHPAFLFGVVITALIMALATSRDSGGGDWLRLSQGIALGLAPFGWFTIAATQLLTTRAARTGADSLLASLPAPQPTRTAGLLGTMVGAVGVAAAWVVVTVAYLSRQDRVFPGSPDVFEIGAGLLLLAGAVAVGVAVGRFLPHPLFAVGGAIAVILIQARFLDPTTWPWDSGEASPVRFFGFLASSTSARPELEYRPAAWHVVYLAGLIAVMAVVALARNGMPRPLTGALATALAVTALAGWMQTRPVPDARLAEMISFLEEPAKHQECVDRASGRYCTYPNGERHLDQWDARATRVLALAPATPGRLKVAERMPTVIGNDNCSPIPFTEALIPDVLSAIDPARVWARDGVVHPGTEFLSCSTTSVDGFFFAVQVGSWAVGLPSSPGAGDGRCYASGEARSALALWLGAAATPTGPARLEQLLTEEGGSHLSYQGWTDPPMWGVSFALTDGRVALAMLGRKAEDVSAALAPHWARLTAPNTPTSELVALLGLGNLASEHTRPTPACT